MAKRKIMTMEGHSKIVSLRMPIVLHGKMKQTAKNLECSMKLLTCKAIELGMEEAIKAISELKRLEAEAEVEAAAEAAEAEEAAKEDSAA